MRLRAIIFSLATVCAASGVIFAGPAKAQTKEDLALAMQAVKDRDWDAAPDLAGPKGSIARDIIDWHRLRASEGTAEEALDFLARNSDWPGLPYLRKQSELVLDDASRDTILRYFDGQKPRTAEGALALARAKFAVGEKTESAQIAMNAWVQFPMDKSVQDQYLESFPATLAKVHDRRLDLMLWGGHYGSAQNMLPLASDGAAALGRARLALYRLQSDGVNALIDKVPSSRRDDAGLRHARATWRWRKGNEAGGYELMQASSTSAKSLKYPGYWAQLRRAMAREAMRDGDPELAYRVAANHHVSPKSFRAHYADLEWIAGYVALRKLDRPGDALAHFQRFDKAVYSPISKGRSGYWRGRAHAALGQTDAAYTAYAEGAEHQTSFYGLLAAEQIGRPFDPDLAKPPALPSYEGAPFLSSRVFQAGILLLGAGEGPLGERFLTHLTETLPSDQKAQLAGLATEFGEVHVAVMIAKRAIDYGTFLPGPYYAMHPVAEMKLPMAPEMTLSIARRESEFDHKVSSGVGAMGLMQVMPRTAAELAENMGKRGHTDAKMLSDWQYNAELGTQYLSELAGMFDGNVVLMSVAYNAGPSRPPQWIERFGDPRSAQVDIVDWVEHIPFRETRNYVMRVTESLPVYRARLGQDALPVPFSRELTGSTLRAFAPEGE